MSAKRAGGRTGRPVKVPGEKGTKEKIFDAAVALFAEKGYDGVSIRDIGRAVGVTESAVYRHYPSKDAILESIFDYVQNRIYPAPAPGWSIEALVETTPFREILASMPSYMLADPYMQRIMRIMIIEMYHNKKIRDYMRKEIFERPVDEMEQLFMKLSEKGMIKPCDPRAMATLFISLLVYWYFEVFIFNYGETLELESLEKTSMDMVNKFADILEPGCDLL